MFKVITFNVSRAVLIRIMIYCIFCQTLINYSNQWNIARYGSCVVLFILKSSAWLLCAQLIIPYPNDNVKCMVNFQIVNSTSWGCHAISWCTYSTNCIKKYYVLIYCNQFIKKSSHMFFSWLCIHLSS